MVKEAKKREHATKDRLSNVNDVSVIDNENETNHIETSSSSKKKKGRKEKSLNNSEHEDGTEESLPNTNMGLSQADPAINNSGSDERKKKKKKKKDNDKEVEAQQIESKEMWKAAKKLTKQEHAIKDRLSNVIDVSIDDIQINTSEISSSNKKKKRRKDKSLNVSENGDVTQENEDVTQESLPKKKRKKNEKLSSEDSSLGFVDVDILKQAGTNMGLPMADQTEADSVTNNSGGDKKKKKKKGKDKKIEAQQADTTSGKSRNEKVLDYLRLWSSNRKAWKFNKMFQVNLLHIMYDKSLVSEEDFEVVLQYLEGLRGKAKDKTREEAEKVLKDEKPDTETADREERARQILQILN
ncbi:unnamed protein product [Lymnaea stagnalis]|uniref:WKF domain-containing protein n=1 Tax=Lymnaea stagnalis TaxID=6523 RepID=A0AAV2GXZ8_LYMST